jgi:glucose/arabinose dehydrogenase
MAQKDNFNKHPAKFLSIFVERMVPDYVREDHPMFITFLRKYFEYLERETSVNGELGEYTQITELIQNLDIDHALDSFIPEFEKQYLHGTPHTAVDPTVATTDKAFLAKNIQTVYRQKGTTNALNFLFRRDFDANVETLYPKQWMWRASGSVWYEPEWITILTDKAATDPASEYYQETVNVQLPETVRNIYNKKIIGQTSGATAFVDLDEDITTSSYEKLLLTEVNGVFVKDEEIWEDTGTQLNAIPYVAQVISEGIRTEGECIVNGHRWNDKWFHVTGHPNEVPKLPLRPLITGLTNSATAEIKGFDVDYTKMKLANVDGTYQLGEKVTHTLAFQYQGSYPGNAPTDSFCTVSVDWPADPITQLSPFDNMIDCEAALHPEGEDSQSAYFGEPAFLEWFPVLELTSDVLTVENAFLTGITESPTTREDCEVLLNSETQPDVKTSVWKTNGFWLDSAGFLSSDRKMQDNDYYQDFSYVVKSSVPVQSYREVLKKLVHPVGLKLFAEFSYNSSIDLEVALPTEYTKLLIHIFGYLDVAIDIWDQETEQHGTLGHAHTGFELYLDKAFEEYVIEILGTLDNKSALISAAGWSAPGDHLSIIFDIDVGYIGTRVKEKLYTVSWLNQAAFGVRSAFPETVTLDFLQHLKVLPITEFPPSVQELIIRDDLYSATDGSMISCAVWELNVYKHLHRVIEWVQAFMPEAEYAPEKSYGHFEAHREDTIVQKIYGTTNDVIDSVEMQAFEQGDIIHSHGRKNGFAPLVRTMLTKGLTLPDMTISSSAFHVHEFETPAVDIPNLIIHGKTATTAGLSYTQARDLINRNAFEIPKLYAGKHDTAFLPEATNHVHFFEEGQIVDRQRGRVANCLRRQEARDLIDGVLTSVILYDNIGKLDDDTNAIVDGNGVFQGGTIEDGNGDIVSAHYHQYTVTYDSDWKNQTDFQGNALSHGFVYTPNTTWVCYNYRPELIVDENIMGGSDYAGNTWPQNVFQTIDDTIIQTHLTEPSFTFHHSQVWLETLNPNVDWVELYSSNFVQAIPGSGDTGDLVGDVLVSDQTTDTATIEAYPMDPDKICIVDQSGIIHLLHTTTGVKELFMDLTTIQHAIGVGPFGAYDERGCLGLAFNSDYANNGKFYVFYMTEQGPATGSFGYPLSSTHISEFTANVAAGTADVSTERNLLIIPQPDMNHNGGELCIGPDDMLYIGLGDGGNAGDTSASSGHGGHGLYGNAQNPSNLLGNILRIDPEPDTVAGTPYTIPPDNPFKETPRLYGDTGLVYFKEEIWAYGFRNPWRFSFDDTGRLWAADVGQNIFEEINIVEKGGNYGWRVIEGYHNYEEDQAIIDQIALNLQYANTNEFLNDLKKPIHEYSHWTGISILGGFVYRGSLLTGLQDKYIFGDWSANWGGTSGHIFSLEEDPGGMTAFFSITPNAVNGSTHSHTCELTPSEVTFCQENPGTSVFVVQTDNVHSHLYTHTFEIVWNGTFNVWNLLSQTNTEGHDVFTFLSYSDPDGLGVCSDPQFNNNAVDCYGEGDCSDPSYDDNATGCLNAGACSGGTDYWQLYTDEVSCLAASGGIWTPGNYTWTSANNTWVPEFSGEIGYTRKALSFWDPVSEVVTLTTHDMSILTMGEDTDGEIYLATRIGINTYQGSGPNNTSIYKLTETFDSSTETPAQAQIPASEMAHVHGYEVTYDSVAEAFTATEISDIEMSPWDGFYPEWTYNDPVSHLHPVITYWVPSFDVEIPIGSSAGWHYNEETEQWEPYSIGADTPWQPQIDDEDATIYIETAPILEIFGAHEYGENDHVHYFDGSTLDTFGTNSDRIAVPITRIQAEQLANAQIPNVIVYCSLTNSGQHIHYHKYKILWNTATQQFSADEMEELYDASGTGAYTPVLEINKTHEHTLAINGVMTHLGWNGTPLYTAPDITMANAHDWDELQGSEVDHLHSFNETYLDTIGVNAGRQSLAIDDNQTTDLINGDLQEITLYTSIGTGDHYHGVKVTYDENYLVFVAEDIEKWSSPDGLQFYLEDPRTHAHPTEVQALASWAGFNESMVHLPAFGSPGFPYPGGSHPHFHNNTLVGPFAWNNEVAYASGITIAQGMQLIDGLVDSVTIYDSIEGAHFHEYVIKWDDPNDIFYVENSTTWLRGGIEDPLQDPSKYYISQVEQSAEGLHWHNLTIAWNPLELGTGFEQQTGGSIYVTKIEPVDQVLTSAPNIVTTQTSTQLAPVSTTYPDTPSAGDETIIIVYSDLVTTTITTTTQITTTTTTTTFFSDYGTSVVVDDPVITYDVTTQVSTATVEDLTERKTYINTVLQANHPPILYIQPSFIEGEGSHDHLLYEDCELDSAGQYAGRMCEPITLGQANQLINEQDVNYGIIFFDSPNGADSHYHAYTIHFNPYAGTDGEFEVDGLSQYDMIPGTGTTVHQFILSGGYHTHDYWISVTDYIALITGTWVVTPQRDDTHASAYTHELTLSYDGAAYDIEAQTSDYDNHNIISYTGSVPQGGEWLQSTAGQGLGDHEHQVVIDDSDVWPVDPS